MGYELEMEEVREERKRTFHVFKGRMWFDSMQATSLTEAQKALAPGLTAVDPRAQGRTLHTYQEGGLVTGK